MIDYIWIGKSNMDRVEVLIPPLYQDALLKGELQGVLAYDSTENYDYVVGVCLFRKRMRWMEIVWTAVTQDYRGTDTEDQMMFDIISMIPAGEDVEGAFAEFSVEEVDFRDRLARAGFCVNKSLERVYEVTRDMLDEEKLEYFIKHAPKPVSLEKADKAVKVKVQEMIRKDHREEIPVASPIDWKKYDPNLSFLYLTDDSFAMLLASAEEQYITLNALVSQSPLGMSSVISGFWKSYMDNYSSQAMIGIPIIDDTADSILHKLIPDIKMKEVYQAFMRFEDTKPAPPLGPEDLAYLEDNEAE